jgi:hypothetical protein
VLFAIIHTYFHDIPSEVMIFPAIHIFMIFPAKSLAYPSFFDEKLLLSFTYVRFCYVMRVNPVEGTSYEIIRIRWYINHVEIINPYTVRQV